MKESKIDVLKAIELRNQDPPVTWNQIGDLMGVKGPSVQMAVRRHLEAIENQGPPIPPETVAEKAISEQIEGKPIVSGGETLKEVKKKSATKPWNADHNPWTRSMLDVVGAGERRRQGFRLRWVNKNNVEKKSYEGWHVANKKDYKGLKDVIIGEEGQMDSTIRRRELVLMEMPEEMAAQRDAYFEEKVRKRSADARYIAQRQANKLAQQGADPQLKPA